MPTNFAPKSLNYLYKRYKILMKIYTQFYEHAIRFSIEFKMFTIFITISHGTKN